MYPLRRVYVLIVLLALIAASTVSVVAQAPQGNGVGIRVRDAQQYAADYGVSVAEALRRFQLQDLAGELDATLTARESGIFAGLWVQHIPEFRIVVSLTTGGKERLQPYITSRSLANIVEVRPARFTRTQLEAAHTIARHIVEKLGLRVDSGTNVYTNRVEVYVTDRAQLDNALRTATVRLPDNVDVVTVKQLAKPAGNIYAGLATNGQQGIYTDSCTTGWSVRDLNGRYGISTAGHCFDTRTVNGTSIQFVTGRTWGSFDIQWHLTPNFTPRNLFYDGSSINAVTALKYRGYTAVGDYVCKYGRSSGYACGNIADKNFQPNANYITSPNPTFVRVHRPTFNLSVAGDSGGPWFNENTAYGIMSGWFTPSGQSEVDGVYMAIDYYNDLGLTILTQ